MRELSIMCYRAATSVAIFLFWVEIRNRTQAIVFNRYNKLINAILLCWQNSAGFHNVAAAFDILANKDGKLGFLNTFFILADIP